MYPFSRMLCVKNSYHPQLPPFYSHEEEVQDVVEEEVEEELPPDMSGQGPDPPASQCGHGRLEIN